MQLACSGSASLAAPAPVPTSTHPTSRRRRHHPARLQVVRAADAAQGRQHGASRPHLRACKGATTRRGLGLRRAGGGLRRASLEGGQASSKSWAPRAHAENQHPSSCKSMQAWAARSWPVTAAQAAKSLAAAGGVGSASRLPAWHADVACTCHHRLAAAGPSELLALNSAAKQVRRRTHVRVAAGPVAHGACNGNQLIPVGVLLVNSSEACKPHCIH